MHIVSHAHISLSLKLGRNNATTSLRILLRYYKKFETDTSPATNTFTVPGRVCPRIPSNTFDMLTTRYDINRLVN